MAKCSLRCVVLVLLLSPAASLWAETIRVRVITPDAKPVDDARVTLISSAVRGVITSGSEFMLTHDGRAVFSNVNVGTHQVEVTKTGYLPARVEKIRVEARIPPTVGYGELVIVLNPVIKPGPYQDGPQK